MNRWLRSERDADGVSDRALRRVFQALPAPPLPAAFTHRVMLGAGLELPRRAAAPLAWRIALAVALGLAALATAAAPRFVLGLLRQISPGDVLRFAAGAVVETCQRLAEGLSVWQTVSSIGATFSEVLSTPPILAFLLAATLLSASGFRMLYGLLAIDRRSENARA